MEIQINNLVAKHSRKINRHAVHVDRKQAAKREGWYAKKHTKKLDISSF